MAKAKNKNIEKAKQLYDSGMPMVKIAKHINVSAATIRSWKSRYKWDGDSTQHEKCNVAKGNATLQRKNESQKEAQEQKEYEPDFEELHKILDESNLTDKQKLFCVYYIRCFNATKAYQKSHPDCSRETAAVEGHRSLRNPKISYYIKALKQSKLNQEMISSEDIVQRYLDIAFADISDYVFIKNNYITFRDSDEFDGSIIKKISVGKVNSIEIQDRMQALKWLADHMDLATEKQKAEIDLLQAKVKDQTDGDRENKNDALNSITDLLDQVKQIADEDTID